ncbi:MAG TPA: sporulation protein YqfD, partial [Symbiobacteriaceae bacterium]
ITGPAGLDPRAGGAGAAEAGLKPGVWKGRVDVNGVQQHIQQHMGEVSWAVVRVQGTRAVIEVVEKAARKPTSTPACINLVAKKNGVVEQVVPFLGEPVVKKGDVVKAGDLLVECSLRYWKDGRPSVYPGTPLPPRESIARTLVAQALVKARVNYRDYREVPLVQEVPVPTGRTATRWVLNWKDQPIILRGEPTVPFLRYQEHRQTYSLAFWRNWGLPVELQMVNIEEVEVRTERIPLAEALAQAKAQMAVWLRWNLGASDQILGEIRVNVGEQGSDYAGIQVSAEVLEEIAAPQEGSPPAPPPPPGGTPGSTVP